MPGVLSRVFVPLSGFIHPRTVRYECVYCVSGRSETSVLHGSCGKANRASRGGKAAYEENRRSGRGAPKTAHDAKVVLCKVGMGETISEIPDAIPVCCVRPPSHSAKATSCEIRKTLPGPDRGSRTSQDAGVVRSVSIVSVAGGSIRVKDRGLPFQKHRKSTTSTGHLRPPDKNARRSLFLRRALSWRGGRTRTRNHRIDSPVL